MERISRSSYMSAFSMSPIALERIPLSLFGINWRNSSLSLSLPIPNKEDFRKLGASRNGSSFQRIQPKAIIFSTALQSSTSISCRRHGILKPYQLCTVHKSLPRIQKAYPSLLPRFHKPVLFLCLEVLLRQV